MSAENETPGFDASLMPAGSGDPWRHLSGFRRYLVPVIAVCWSLFQLAIASNWAVQWGETEIMFGKVLDSTYTRCIHLAFALAIAFLGLVPMRKPRFGVEYFSDRRRLHFFDILLAVVGALAALYLVFFYEDIAQRAGKATAFDIAVGVVLLVVVLEACRRSIGPALSVLALMFILYAFFAESAPGPLASRATSLPRFIDQMTLGTEGVFGVPLYVSATKVYLFVLFGAMLERSGGGRYFTNLALSVLGRFRGGPAKAAVLSSGLTGMISGSSIANIVTTGTFTIPLMKKVGYPPRKAAAIEVAASTDGQLAPPIMGAAAFIIAEYVTGANYVDVIKAAAIPAFASYAALIYITHIEACKLGLKGMSRDETPVFHKVLASGLHYLLPVGFLLYLLVIMRFQPETAAFTCCMVMGLITVLQRPVVALATKSGQWKKELGHGFVDLWESLAAGGKNMVSVALACAGAGVIVGVVSMGLGGIITQLVEAASMGYILLMLIITALACLIIGMGLPTTATYITMATLTAPIIVSIGETHTIVIPLMAAHLFVFYFGILADDTPPVGLAAYAAAAIAKSEPIPTGIQAFLYDIRTAILPFMFIFNADLILHGIDSVPFGIYIFAMACVANFAFAAVTQGWFATKNRWYEVPFLLAVTLILFRPDLIARWLSIPYGQRYWTSLIGLALFFGVYGWQRVRTKADRMDSSEVAA